MGSVWLEKRKLKRGYSYDLRWRNPVTGEKESENVGRDSVRARTRLAEKLKELTQGTEA